ncbi:MAG: hypothetical protein LBS84_11650 [Clostridiales bacterium]|jgi:hypothetical protein|nr:hypothetical protein [Clostridiales bacterium]
MKSFFTSRKGMAVISCISLAALLVSGTFAWASLNSQKVNEWRGTGSTSEGSGGSLHDDHDNSNPNDPRKDVYVENWGDDLIFTRIRLSEYMEIGINAGKMDPNTTSQVVRLPVNESLPLLEGTVLAGGVIQFTPHIPKAADPADCGEDFHQYWNWEMGGKKFYKRASEAEKAAGRQNNGSVLSDNNDYTTRGVGLEETLDGGVYVLDENSTPGTGWFIDEDGWAYWGGFLQPGQATSLLLHRVTRTNIPIPDSYYYAINVEAHMWDAPDVLPSPGAVSTMTEPDDVFALIQGVGVEKPSDNALSFLKKVFIKAVDEGEFGEDVETSIEVIEEIFAAEEPPVAN